MKCKCKMCGKQKDWESTVGRRNFIICNDCVAELHSRCGIKKTDVVNMIFYVGYKKERKTK